MESEGGREAIVKIHSYLRFLRIGLFFLFSFFFFAFVWSDRNTNSLDSNLRGTRPKWRQ